MNTATNATLLRAAALFLRDARIGLGLLCRHIADLSTSVSNAREVAHLSELSDAELDELGMTRDDIVHSVFGQN